MEPSPPSPARLPPEIHLMILDYLFCWAVKTGHSLAPYACVCAQWRAVIEQRNFRSLTLTPDRLRLPEFADMLHRARKLGLVRHLELYVPLAEYDCPDCEHPTSGKMPAVEQALRQTFALLGAWSRRGALSLDIGIQSPSDARHYFKLLPVRGRAWEPWPHRVKDPRHGWDRGFRPAKALRGAVDRVFEYIRLPHDLWDQLPRVTAVTSLDLRRQTTRRWRHRDVAGLVNCLVGLQELHYEPWRYWSQPEQLRADLELADMIQALPRVAENLSKLVIFDAADSFVFMQAVAPLPVTPRDRDARDPPDRCRSPSGKVALALARAGALLRNLECLSVSFCLDARVFAGFVRQVTPPGSAGWARLTQLTLTAHDLDPDSTPRQISEVLKEAAAAARLLPALEVMKLWNGGRGFAALFRYEAPPPPPPPSVPPMPCAAGSAAAVASVSWRSTWDVELESSMVEAWKETARQRRPGCELRCERQVFGMRRLYAFWSPTPLVDFIDSVGDAIYALRLSQEVAHPTSVEQMRSESNARPDPWG